MCRSYTHHPSPNYRLVEECFPEIPNLCGRVQDDAYLTPTYEKIEQVDYRYRSAFHKFKKSLLNAFACEALEINKAVYLLRLDRG